jgi:hypothetical protein
LKTKIFSSSFKNELAYYNVGVVAVNSKVLGLAPVYLANKKFTIGKFPLI